MIELATPHIPLGASIEEALMALEQFGKPVQDVSEEELCYRIETASFRMAVYPIGDVVGSVWYDDPSGRGSESGRASKVEAYLRLYGQLKNWERRLDNGWMHYWFNPADRAQMVYGVHNDVVRFNQYVEDPS
jgi:hypothetical protein